MCARQPSTLTPERRGLTPWLCAACAVLVLEGNRLTGALPPHMPPRMAYIDLHDNMLTGTIPAWQWNRDAPRIHVVLLHMNKLSGTVPYALTKRTVRDPLLAPYDFIPIHLDWLLGFQRHYVFRVRSGNSPGGTRTRTCSVAAALSASESSSPHPMPFSNSAGLSMSRGHNTSEACTCATHECR
jgi:hypothetical protein